MITLVVLVQAVVVVVVVLHVFRWFVGHGGGDHGVSSHVIDDIAVVTVEDGAWQPLVWGLGGGFGGRVEVEEIGVSVVVGGVVVVVVVVGVGGGVVVLGLGA